MKKVYCSNCASQIFLPIADLRNKTPLTKEISFRKTNSTTAKHSLFWGKKMPSIILGNGARREK